MGSLLAKPLGAGSKLLGFKPKPQDDWENILGSLQKQRAPSLTDEVIHKAALSQRMRTGRGRASTFLSGQGAGPLGY
jgi:hypothetical protein